ncbi:uncharacterized protein RCO7_14879 [Rhynchosporium graminicola]|uniref:Uncharacterized protein n=1 Tax=Rhynchosporium graminicola TaxID=2792576 RepID=A0A1E1L805_9HELO|nr:uncharacterized protein RCO7_14879 [Rhynchosporium commune]
MPGPHLSVTDKLMNLLLVFGEFLDVAAWYMLWRNQVWQVILAKQQLEQGTR